MWRWLELVGERLVWWKGRVDMYGLYMVMERRRWQQPLPSSMHLVAGRLQAEAVLTGLLLSSDPLWSYREVEMQK